LYVLGDIELDQGDLTTAEENYQTGLRLATQIGDKPTVALGRLSLGGLRLQAGRAAEAEVLTRQAAEEFNAQGFKDAESSARNRVAFALLDLGRVTDAAKEMDLINQLKPQDPTITLAVAITAGRIQMRSGKLAAGKRELDAVASEAKRLGIPGLQFEARLAQGEVALFGGDKRTALSLLSILQKDAAKRGFRQIEVRARAVARQISASTAG